MIKKLIKKLHYRLLGFIIGKTPVIANVDVRGATLTKAPDKGIRLYSAIVSDCAFVGKGKGK